MSENETSRQADHRQGVRRRAPRTVGSAIWRLLESEGYTQLVGRTSELDLRDRTAVFDFMAEGTAPTS